MALTGIAIADAICVTSWEQGTIWPAFEEIPCGRRHELRTAICEHVFKKSGGRTREKRNKEAQNSRWISTPPLTCSSPSMGEVSATGSKSDCITYTLYEGKQGTSRPYPRSHGTTVECAFGRPVSNRARPSRLHSSITVCNHVEPAGSPDRQRTPRHKYHTFFGRHYRSNQPTDRRNQANDHWN